MSNKIYIVAKIIGTETGRVLAKSVEGTEDIKTLASQLATNVETTIANSGHGLMPVEMNKDDVIANIRKMIGSKKFPPIYVSIAEKHIGTATTASAAETELIYILKELGSLVIDQTSGDVAKAGYKITGEGFSEFATKTGNLVSVKARLEVKVLDKEGKIVAIDRQTSVKVDLNEMLAGKAALQEAASLIAKRLLPKLAE